MKKISKSLVKLDDRVNKALQNKASIGISLRGIRLRKVVKDYLDLLVKGQGWKIRGDQLLFKEKQDHILTSLLIIKSKLEVETEKIMIEYEKLKGPSNEKLQERYAKNWHNIKCINKRIVLYNNQKKV